MARQARMVFPGVPMYIMVKGDAHTPVFPSDETKLTYLAWLRGAASQYELLIHAYALLPNEFHLLATAPNETALARTMQSLGRRYTQYFHKQFGGQGAIWVDRYRSSPIDPQNYFLICQRFIERLPMEMGLVMKPEDYPWSTMGIHIGKEPNYGLHDGAPFWNLGNTPFERQLNWKLFVEEGNDPKQKEVITNSLQSKDWIGDSEIWIGDKLVRSIPLKKRGRPKKTKMVR